MKAKALLLICSILLLAVNAHAQTNVAPGEQRFNRFQYHATHNSFQRPECGGISLTTQLDRHDVWMIELDLVWRRTVTFDDFWVHHHCADPCGSDSLARYLEEIRVSKRATTGLTILYFNSGGEIENCPNVPNIVAKPAGWQSLLKATLTNVFGDRFFTWDNLLSPQGTIVWPSPQQILRSGKNFIVILDHSDDPFFFENKRGEYGVVYTNTDQEDVPMTPALLGDRYTARHYPTGFGCVEPETGWAWGVRSNYTFSASNCPDKHDSPLWNRLHPALPTYVDQSEGIGGRGSWLDPFGGPNALAGAIERIAAHESIKGPSIIDVQIAGGVHAGHSRIAIAVRLSRRDGAGTVRITP